GGGAASRIAAWNPSVGWWGLGGAMNKSVSALAVYNDSVIAGGSFITADGATVNRIARWDGHDWTCLGSGTNGSIYALQVIGPSLYVGGAFTTAGRLASAHIARRDDPRSPVSVDLDPMPGRDAGLALLTGGVPNPFQSETALQAILA